MSAAVAVSSATAHPPTTTHASHPLPCMPPPHMPPPWTEFLTHACENITTVADGNHCYYRSRTKLREGNVLHLCVILFTGGGDFPSRVRPPGQRPAGTDM